MERNHSIGGFLALECAYGENPQQAPAGLYEWDSTDPFAPSTFKLVAGSPPSYNGLRDRDRLLQTMTHIAASYGEPHLVPAVAVAVKHGNACGAGIGERPLDALQKMIEGDPLAIFGGVVMANFLINEELADALLHHALGPGQERRILDGVITPWFTEGAIEVLARRKGKCRLMAHEGIGELDENSLDRSPRITYVRGGFLVQPNYTFVLDFGDPQLQVFGVTDPVQESDIRLAWAIGSTSNSNTVTLVHNGKLIGNGVGQQDRAFACEIAVLRARRAGHNPLGAVAYSDSFFPFTDGPAILADAGVVAIFASSGSIRDDEVKAFCAKKGITLYMMSDKLCRGFFGH